MVLRSAYRWSVMSPAHAGWAWLAPASERTMGALVNAQPTGA